MWRYLIPAILLLAALLAGPYLVLRAHQRRPPNLSSNPDAAMLRADEQTLGTAPVSGDVRLSQLIRDQLVKVINVEQARVQDYKVFTAVRSERVLVLVEVPNLANYRASARLQLLDMIGLLLSGDDAAHGKSFYIGVRSGDRFGAVRVPGETATADAPARFTLLYEFYAGAPTTRPATAPATQPS